ncbi:unnamed protein product [Haemonchus placei]|uniref:Protein max n=1 Tax=Haemonchus placei TaxID=6290 RepID=A0A0N4WBC7_HAEPC|nr:unnamed protein product [Haemonchus placei]
MIKDLKREINVKHMELQTEMDNQSEKHAKQKTKLREVNTEELEEDPLGLDYEFEESQSRDDSINTLSYSTDDDNTRYPGH